MVTWKIEFFKEILESTDVTVIGLLTFTVLVLLYFVKTLSNRINERDLYIREQDRTTLEILGGITGALKERNNNEAGLKQVVEGVKDGVSDIKNTVDYNKISLNSLSTLIQAKLITMDNGSNKD